MIKKPKISIITVSYNSGSTIKQTIKSVIDQDYENIEYIIIDGNSSDNTLNVIRQYSEFIHFFISEEDNGIYDAMNKGIKNSSGDYVHLLNAGDIYYSSDVFDDSHFLDGKDFLIWSRIPRIFLDSL